MPNTTALVRCMLSLIRSRTDTHKEGTRMTMIPALLLQSDDAAATVLLGLGGTFLIFMLVIAVIFIIGMWKTFVKAGQPGWAAIIPIYNAYILTQIAGRPGWWVLLMLIPLVNIV